MSFGDASSESIEQSTGEETSNILGLICILKGTSTPKKKLRYWYLQIEADKSDKSIKKDLSKIW